MSLIRSIRIGWQSKRGKGWRRRQQRGRQGSSNKNKNKDDLIILLYPDE